MSVKVRIPTPLQPLTDNQPQVAAHGSTLAELLADLEAKFTGIGKRLYDDDGKLRRFVNVYVNDEDIRFLQGEDTPLKEGDEVSIVPAIAGGLTDIADGRV
jgi:molybdopterin synthase sulfur carrier subunit